MVAADRSMGIDRASSWAKWITAGGGLICAAYIYVCLTIPDPAFEWVVSIGMPPDLKVYEKLLFEIPKFAVILSILLMIFTIEVWREKILDFNREVTLFNSYPCFNCLCYPILSFEFDSSN